jgi:hypothetical protein
MLPGALLAALISACADAPTSTKIGLVPNLHVLIEDPGIEWVSLCKAGPAGTYTFDATADFPVLLNTTTGAFDQSAATYTIVVSPSSTITIGGSPVSGACFDYQGHNHIALQGGGRLATVTVVETPIPAGVDFDHVVVYQKSSGTVNVTSSTTNSAVGQAGGPAGAGASMGAAIVFYNVTEPPPGGEGCTPGYWKQQHHFDSWTAPYDPTDSFNTTFGDTWFTPDITLLQALQLGGGGKNALARHAVAALLNAASDDVDAAQSISEVLAAMAAAFDDQSTIESTKNIFATNNELGCPLN